MADRGRERPERDRVVVTGMGIYCPVGNSLDDVWNALIEGRSGTATITRFDPADVDSKIAGEVKDFDPKAILGSKEARRTDRYVQFAVASAQDARSSASLDITPTNANRIGVLLGTAMGGMETIERELDTLDKRGPRRVSPFFIPMFLADMASGYVSIVLGAKGPNYSTLSACASAAHAIGESVHIIRRGDADVMITGGSEAAVTQGSVAGFDALGALSTRNDEPETASRPFDAGRDGFVIGEGAAVLILESLDHAERRGAPILAEVSGYGASGDACHIVQPSPDGDGASRALRAAIESMKINASDVDYINAHGTSTPLNDRLETLSVKTVFDEGAIPPVSSTKALTGHLLGAGGAIEAVFTVQAIENQIVPPTWNYRDPDPECDLDYVTDGPRPARIEHALSNSLGFGGHNVTLGFSRVSER